MLSWKVGLFYEFTNCDFLIMTSANTTGSESVLTGLNLGFLVSCSAGVLEGDISPPADLDGKDAGNVCLLLVDVQSTWEAVSR